jgi:hypothetical protein
MEVSNTCKLKRGGDLGTFDIYGALEVAKRVLQIRYN